MGAVAEWEGKRVVLKLDSGRDCFEVDDGEGWGVRVGFCGKDESLACAETQRNLGMKIFQFSRAARGCRVIAGSPPYAKCSLFHERERIEGIDV